MPDEQYPEFKTPSEKLISDQCTDLSAGSHSQSSGSEAHGSISQSNPTSNSGAIDELGLIGKVIGDHYKILRLIGVGGMGAVYEAQDILLGRQVAIKVASGGLLRSEKSALRFQKEARALGQLDHNNIVRVSDFGIYNEKMPFMVMQFVGGKPLSEVLTQALPINDTITIALQLCNALIHAHEKGIFHRDLKPSNILVEDGLSNNIKIIDFGIATLTSEDNRMHLTNTGEVFGSPLYMSPEQCAGSKADNRSDIYALGCIIYECLTGAPPLVGETALTTMMKHQQDVPLSLKQASLGKEFPPALENIVAKALAKAPEQRYQTIAGLRHDLEAVRDGKSLNIGGEIERTSPAQKADKSLMIGIGLVVGLILLGVGTLVYFFLSDHDQSSPVVAVHEEPTIAFPLAHCAKAMEDAEHGAPSADFTDCADIGADELKRLSNLPNLSELMLSNTSITTHDLAELNPHLIALHLHGCNVNLAGIKHLRDLKELERLEVSTSSKKSRNTTSGTLRQQWLTNPYSASPTVHKH